MSHSFSVLAWGLERSQFCHFWSDSFFVAWEGLEMKNHHDTVASNELGFFYISFCLGLRLYKSVLIPKFLSLSLSTISTLHRTVSVGRISLVLSLSELVRLWLYELDQSVLFVFVEFQVDISGFLVCWQVCDVGPWQLLVWAIHVVSLLVMADLLRLVYCVTATGL